MSAKPICAALLVLFSPALAWSPAPDLNLAQRIVDGVYSRSEALPTFASQSLEVSDGAFSGSEVRLLSGDPGCLSNWLQNPTNYARFGSRPVSLTLAGQAYQIALAAQIARNAFKNISAKEALATSQARLPGGHLQVYVQMRGLAQITQREAYNLGVQAQSGILRPYKSAYLEDWEQAEDRRFGGTMLYYFDLSKANLDSYKKLNLVLQTEVTACTYTIGADLTKFY